MADAPHPEPNATSHESMSAAGETIGLPPVRFPMDEDVTLLHPDTPASGKDEGSRTDIGTGPAERAGEPAPACVPGYDILGELGRGGMGVVYRARQTRLNRLVALKMILAGGHAGAAERQRFLAEAEAVARLQHPNIVQIYEIGEVEARPFFSLEFCAGGSLAARLNGTPLPPGDAARLLATLARAMQTAHDAGVVHRDLKPANVLLAGEAAGANPQAPFVPKIADFGLAKRLDDTSGQTASGTILGTPSYMAPEQAEGRKDIGPAADVWALGAILYELLTGRAPFKGARPLDTVMQVIHHEPVPPRRLNPKVPRDLETVCLKCLQKDPRQRYASALGLARDLEAFGEGRPIQARPVGVLERGWRWARRRPVLAGLAAFSGAALALLLAGGFWYSARLGAARGEAAAARERLAAAETESAAARELAGTREYFILLGRVRERAGRRPRGWTWESAKELSQAAALPPAAAGLPELRTELASCLAGVDVRETGRAAEGLAGIHLAYDPRGRWLAVAELKAQAWASCAVVLADAHTGATVRRLAFPSLEFQVARKVQDGTTALAFSPDGRWLVVGARSGLLHRWDLSAETSRPTSWPGHKDEVFSLAFSPDGKGLLSLAADHTLTRWDTGTWKATAQAASPGDSRCLAVSPAGDQVFLTGNQQLLFLALDTLKPSRPAVPLAGSRFCVSPDGRSLAVETNRVIQLVDADSGKVVRTLREPDGETAHDDNVTALAFSPDGALLVSAAAWAHQVRLWDLAGGRLLSDWVVSGQVEPAFRPDGRALAVLADRQTRLYALGGLDVQTAVGLQPWPVTAVAFHPSGWALACLTGGGDAGGARELVCWSLPGDAGAPTLRKEVPAAGQPGLAFSPDGRELVYAADNKLHFLELGNGSLSGPVVVPDLSGLRFGPSGRLWAAAGDGVRAWDPRGTEPVARWGNQLSGVMTGLGTIRAVAPGREWVVAAGRDGAARILRARDAAPQATGPTTDSPLCSAALNPSETLAAVGTEKGEVLLLAVPSGELVAKVAAHGDAVTALAFAGDSLLLSGACDRTVRLTACSGPEPRELFTLRTGGPVRNLALAPDGRSLAVLVQHERGVRLWHLDRLWRGLDALAPTAPLPPLPEAHGAAPALPEALSRGRAPTEK